MLLMPECGMPCSVSSTLHQGEMPVPTFLVRRVLMTDDLPTLGYPTKPTLMYFLSDRRRLSWRSRLSRLPLPAVTAQSRSSDHTTCTASKSLGTQERN